MKAQAGAQTPKAKLILRTPISLRLREDKIELLFQNTQRTLIGRLRHENRASVTIEGANTVIEIPKEKLSDAADDLRRIAHEHVTEALEKLSRGEESEHFLTVDLKVTQPPAVKMQAPPGGGRLIELKKRMTDDTQTRKQAGEAIAKLNSTDRQEVLKAIEELSELRSTTCAPALASFIEKTEDAELVEKAVDAIKNLGRKGMVENRAELLNSLLAAMEKKKGENKKAILLALPDIAPHDRMEQVLDVLREACSNEFKGDRELAEKLSNTTNAHYMLD